MREDNRGRQGHDHSDGEESSSSIAFMAHLG